MEEKIIQIKLEEIFRSMFKEVPILNDTVTFKDIPEWDSLRHVKLISEVEKVFEINFDSEDMLSMHSFGDIRQEILIKIL